MQNRPNFVRDAALLLAFTVLSMATAGCASTGDSKPAAKTGAETVEPPTTQQDRTISRDERHDGDNFLEIMDQQKQKILDLQHQLGEQQERAKNAETAATGAKERETREAAEVDRLQGLLQIAVAERRGLEEKLLHARLDAIRAEKELYRTKIAAVAGGEVK